MVNKDIEKIHDRISDNIARMILMDLTTDTDIIEKEINEDISKLIGIESDKDNLERE